MASFTRTYSPTLPMNGEVSTQEGLSDQAFSFNHIAPRIVHVRGYSASGSRPTTSSLDRASYPAKDTSSDKLPHNLINLQPHPEPKTDRPRSDAEGRSASEYTCTLAHNSPPRPDTSSITSTQRIAGARSSQTVGSPTHKHDDSHGPAGSSDTKTTRPAIASVPEWQTTVDYEASTMGSLGKNRYCAYRLTLPSEASARYREIQKILEADVRGLVTSIKSNYQILWSYRLCMVGLRSGNTVTVEPTILISCGSLKGKRKIKSSFQRIRPHYLESLGMPLMVVHDKSAPVLAGIMGIPLDEENTSDSNAAGAIHLQRNSSPTCCGLRIMIESGTVPSGHEAYATLGGIIKFGDSLYGLTTAHPIINHQLGSGQHQTWNDSDTLSDSSEGCDSSDDEQTLTEALQRCNPPMQLDHQFPEAERLHSKQDLDLSRLGDVWPGCLSCFSFDGVALSSSGSPTTDPSMSDWAVLKIPESYTQPNSYLKPHGTTAREPSQRCFLRSVASPSQIQSGSVHVLCSAETSIVGDLNTNPASLQLDRGVLDVHEIFLKQPMFIGMSGSWVVRDDQLVGMVVALSNQGLSCYAIPMWRVFQSIHMACGHEVELPDPVSLSKETLEVETDLTEQSHSDQRWTSGRSHSPTELFLTKLVDAPADQLDKSLEPTAPDADSQILWRQRQTVMQDLDVDATLGPPPRILLLLSTDGAPAANLLSVLAVFAQDEFPLSLLYGAFRHAEGNDDMTRVWLVQQLNQLTHTDSNSFHLSDTIERLRTLSLIRFSSDEQCVCLYPRIYAWARERLDSQQRDRVLIAAVCLIALSDGAEMWATIQGRARLRPHLLGLLDHDIGGLFQNGPAEQVTGAVLHCVRLMVTLNLREQAYSVLCAVLLKLKLSPHIPHEDWLELYHHLAWTLHLVGMNERAGPLVKKLDDMQDRSLEPGHPLRLSTKLLINELRIRQLSHFSFWKHRMIPELLHQGNQFDSSHDKGYRAAVDLQLGHAFLVDDNAQAAIQVLEVAERGAKQVFEASDHRLLALQAALGIAYNRAEQWTQAVIVLNIVIANQGPVIDTGNDQQLWNNCHLARALCGRGQYLQAGGLIEEVDTAIQTSARSKDLVQSVRNWQAYLRTMLAQAQSPSRRSSEIDKANLSSFDWFLEAPEPATSSATGAQTISQFEPTLVEGEPVINHGERGGLTGSSIIWGC